ncbi:hypothetical protein HK098_007817 [Nowakowskiella sp. JEL0407]|nr:hypothetical protein HK098_007817 [Nowakowskiella sp. JEL0407]
MSVSVLQQEALQTVDTLLSYWDQNFFSFVDPNNISLESKDKNHDDCGDISSSFEFEEEVEFTGFPNGLPAASVAKFLQEYRTGDALPSAIRSHLGLKPKNSLNSSNPENENDKLTPETYDLDRPVLPPLFSEFPNLGAATNPKRQSRWRYYTKPKYVSEKMGEVRLFTSLSRPTVNKPIPRATGGIWFTYKTGDMNLVTCENSVSLETNIAKQKNGKGSNLDDKKNISLPSITNPASETRPLTAPTLTYQFENQYMTHKLNLDASSVLNKPKTAPTKDDSAYRRRSTLPISPQRFTPPSRAASAKSKSLNKEETELTNMPDKSGSYYWLGPPPPMGHPVKRIPELIISKTQLSDHLAEGKFQCSKIGSESDRSESASEAESILALDRDFEIHTVKAQATVSSENGGPQQLSELPQTLAEGWDPSETSDSFWSTPSSAKYEPGRRDSMMLRRASVYSEQPEPEILPATVEETIEEHDENIENEHEQRPQDVTAVSLKQLNQVDALIGKDPVAPPPIIHKADLELRSKRRVLLSISDDEARNKMFRERKKSDSVERPKSSGTTTSSGFDNFSGQRFDAGGQKHIYEDIPRFLFRKSTYPSIWDDEGPARIANGEELGQNRKEAKLIGETYPAIPMVSLLMSREHLKESDQAIVDVAAELEKLNKLSESPVSLGETTENISYQKHEEQNDSLLIDENVSQPDEEIKESVSDESRFDAVGEENPKNEETQSEDIKVDKLEEDFESSTNAENEASELETELEPLELDLELEPDEEV